MEETKNSCYVVGAGEFYGFRSRPSGEDFVVAADGGYKILEKEQIVPDLVIGDFDSAEGLSGQDFEEGKCILLPCEKDDTDMYAAVCEGLKRGYRVFHIYGGMGGRISHTIANMELLADLSRRGIRAFLYGDRCVITALTDGSMKVPGDFKGYVSVFSHCDRAEGIYLRNLKYPLSDAVLTNCFPLGVSNECIGKEGKISVRKGTVIVVMEEQICAAEEQRNERKI